VTTGYFPTDVASTSSPGAAWHRAIGLPLAGAGRSRVTHEVLIDDGPWGGVPLGGLGSGSIGRTHRGDFARWHLEAGRHHFESIPACQFSVYTGRGSAAGADSPSAHVLSTLRPDTLPTWSWDLPVGAGTYSGLFPSAWFDYEWSALPVRLGQRQFSPVIPGNLRESSYPVGLFEWRVENPSSEPLTVGLMFTWQNLVGHWAGRDRSGGHRNATLRRDGLVGVTLSGPADARGEAWHGGFALVAAEEPGLHLTTRNRFSVDDGADVWADFTADGALDDIDDAVPAAPGEAIGAALAATFELAPGEVRTVAFALAWDFPVVEFGSGRRWHPRYTRFFGTSGGAAWEIAAEGIRHRDEWRAAIDAWQAPTLASPDRPEWYKAALFNELYFLVDGGTIWLDREVGRDPADGVGREPVDGVGREPVDDLGRFALLECFDYPFYNTLDVYFYASFALAMLWPGLATQVVREFVATVPVNDPEVVPVWATGGQAVRKVAGALPHDIGGPGGDPFLKLNHYHLQDPNTWKDLNSKFVLLVWQAVALADGEALLAEAWPGVRGAMRHLAAFDRDGDGLPEHDGVPDQTYDTWPMAGPSAYGGSLWIAALRAGIAMGERVGDEATTGWLRDVLARALPAFERLLWTGTYYRYDAGGGASADSIMADQLVGQWWADATGLGEVARADHVGAALRTVFERNVLGFGGGEMGAVNGIRPDGTLDASSEQSQEVWTGTTYALAAFMAGRGMTAEAWRTASGIARVIEARGYWFRTPEAWDRDGSFRATMYLRPLAIWAIEHALRSHDA
jgi:non-lysosomal glucosylceramidase